MALPNVNFNDPYVILYDAVNSTSCPLRIGERYPGLSGTEDNIDNHSLVVR